MRLVPRIYVAGPGIVGYMWLHKSRSPSWSWMYSDMAEPPGISFQSPRMMGRMVLGLSGGLRASLRNLCRSYLQAVSGLSLEPLSMRHLCCCRYAVLAPMCLGLWGVRYTETTRTWVLSFPSRRCQAHRPSLSVPLELTRPAQLPWVMMPAPPGLYASRIVGM